MASNESGQEFLAWGWFNAVEELVSVINSDSSISDRIQACDVLLSYCARMNQGLGDPWIPFERPELEEDVEDE